LNDEPVIDAALHQRLTDWGRWARQRRWLSSCRSMESRYRPEAGEVFDRDPRPLPVDARDAWLVECCWRTRLPLKARMVLRAYFVTGPGGSGERRTAEEWNRYVSKTCRLLAIKRADWGPAVTGAANMISNALRSAGKYAESGRHRISDRLGKDATQRAA
jgi:hypothetical protein